MSERYEIVNVYEKNAENILENRKIKARNFLKEYI